MAPIPEEGDAHEAMAHRHGDVRAGGRRVHGRRRQRDTPSAVDTGSGASHAPVTLEMWGAWTGRELQQFNKIFDGFTQKYPWITVNSTGGVDDPKIIAAINAGNPPDTVLSFTLDSVGQFCASGAWQDLNPYIEQSGFDVSQFPPSVEAYTSFAGSRCAFPFLTDAQGLYYNTDMFEKAGIAEAPKTLSELQDDAKKLTVFNADGSIKVAGFVPWFGYYEFSTPNLGQPLRREVVQRRRQRVGGRFRSGMEGHVPVAARLHRRRVRWRRLPDRRRQAAAVRRRGGGRVLERERLRGGQDRHELRRRVADGVHRRRGSGPAVRDGAVPRARRSGRHLRARSGRWHDHRDPEGSPHPDEAWLLVDYMATDTATLAYMANNVRNVPTTIESLSSPDLDVTPQFQTFLDIFQNPDSHYKEPSAIGASDQNILAAFAASWQAGKQTDLDGGLASVAQQINDQLAQAAI